MGEVLAAVRGGSSPRRHEDTEALRWGEVLLSGEVERERDREILCVWMGDRVGTGIEGVSALDAFAIFIL